MNIRKNHALRIRAFDELQALKNASAPRKEIISTIHNKLKIPIGTLYGWYRGTSIPYGRIGKITEKPELYYVLGSLLGDGCMYNWRTTYHFTILIGDQRFAEKYAKALTTCTGRRSVAYIDRSKGTWFVRSNNFQLYSLFKNTRSDLANLEKLEHKNYRSAALAFIEGVFDAEGCVKIIKEKSRKTPKICLDICNTDANT